ncbi:hypothetical protein E3C22_16610 [Jiella endophytica]|uniref:Phage head morphogenesis domain-containing protein n=1 Tax=Jiella endophytica TaxID=2558362 RepID=A0A4Y8RGE4_9HYPH|nr:phage minor head protein [Jiella endophytica]TFF20530.1 hypothetical protein E3C22_16610 [Jiella endophytica]
MATELQALPFAEAIAALQRRGKLLKSQFAWQDDWQADHAAMFTVAKSTGFDILGDVFEGLSKAVAEGRTVAEFSKELRPLLEAKGWWGQQRVVDPLSGEETIAQLGSTRRLQFIFDVNMRVSYAARHWSSFERNKRARPYLRYVHLEGQEHPRLQHQAWHNIVLPVDHPWWNTHACPNGWGCHCTLQSLSQRDVDRLMAQGVPLKFAAPATTSRDWINKRTGEILKVPDGIDPGWAYNPGKAGRDAVVRDALSAKVAEAPEELRRSAIADVVASDEFARFLEDPQGSLPVMAIGREIADALGADTTVALLSADTVVKQKQRHPELTIEDYRRLPAIGIDPTLVVQDGETTMVYVKEDDDRWLHAAVKVTRSRKAAFLTSFRFTGASNIRSLFRRGIRVLLDRR